MKGRVELPPDLAYEVSEIDSAPEWSDVLDDSARLRVAAAQYEALAIAGLVADSMTLAVSDHWPSDVSDAFERLGLYDRYSPTTLHGVIAHLTVAQQQGITNSVKGTLFEVRVVDHINHGQLQIGDATSAVLPSSLNQPGWDATLVSKSGSSVDHVQMKATSDWHVLAKHLDRYPQIPNVVTTHEAASAASLHDLGGNIIDSGISNAEITQHVQGVVEHLDAAHAIHEFVPEFALVAILAAASMRLQRGDDKAEVGRWVAEQASISGAANLASLAVQVATGTALVRPFVSLGTRFSIARAQMGRKVASRMAEIRDDLRDTRSEFIAGLTEDD